MHNLQRTERSLGFSSWPQVLQKFSFIIKSSALIIAQPDQADYDHLNYDSFIRSLKISE
jgi:hypothetical protein